MIATAATTLASAETCPAAYNGRLAINECHGYIDCMNGFEVNRANCQDDMLYSSSTENCESSDLVTECSVIVAAATDAPLPTTSLLRATRPASSTEPQVVYDGHDSVAVFSTATAVESTPETPVLIDDKEMWVPDTTQASSTTPQVVIDGPDALAPLTTVPAGNVVTTTPKVFMTVLMLLPSGPQPKQAILLHFKSITHLSAPRAPAFQYTPIPTHVRRISAVYLQFGTICILPKLLAVKSFQLTKSITTVASITE
ncbi:hypothetical protein ACHAXN_006675 [Cyclotella atomus]